MASKAAEREAAAWNKVNPIGTDVRFWPGCREGPGRVGQTRSAAWSMCGHASVLITGSSGSISLSHVAPLKAEINNLS